MDEPAAKAGAPEKTIFLMIGLFEKMQSALRLSADPEMLRVAQSLNGPDFVPYNDTIFLMPTRHLNVEPNLSGVSSDATRSSTWKSTFLSPRLESRLDGDVIPLI